MVKTFVKKLMMVSISLVFLYAATVGAESLPQVLPMH